MNDLLGAIMLPISMFERHTGIILIVVFAYLWGSLPFGYWFSRIVKGKDFDIRDWGSGNIGYTNVKGVLGKRIGIPVIIFDVSKGFIPVFAANYFSMGEYTSALCLIASAIGHSYSWCFYLKEGVFSGGKAVATLFGGILALHPMVAATAFFVWVVTLKKTDYMSVASMLAGVSTIPTAIALQMGNWIWLYVFVASIILYKHNRNIGRLVHHIEPKNSEKRGAHHTGDEAVMAFVIHPSGEDDLLQSPLSSWITKLLKRGVISERMVRRIVRYGKVIERAEPSSTTEQGIKYRVIFLAIPLMPDQIDKNPELTRAFLKRAVVIAQRRGARVLGLGGLSSTVFKDVKEIDRLDVWAEGRGFSIKCDNGAAFTAASTLIALQKTLDEKGLHAKELIAAVIGAKGAIGLSVSRALREENDFKTLYAVLRDKRAKSNEAIILENVIETTEKDTLATADIIISCTSSPKPIFNLENHSTIKKGAIFLDVAFPPDFDKRILDERKDITLVACGLILPPREFNLPIDIHFGSLRLNGKKQSLIPACLAQCIMLGITERYEYATLGAVKKESVKFFAEQSFVHGFDVIASSLTEQDIYAGIKR